MERITPKIGTANIDINEYDRLISIEKYFEKKVDENTAAIKFLKAFIMMFNSMERENAYSVMNDIVTKMDNVLVIKTNNGEINVGHGKTVIRF